MRPSYAGDAAEAARVPVLLGHSASLHFHAILRPQFFVPWNASRSFIGLAKMSYTAETLYKVPYFLKFLEKI
jgi:hypothetical protein